jgi:hypothetical protein
MEQSSLDAFIIGKRLRLGAEARIASDETTLPPPPQKET